MNRKMCQNGIVVLIEKIIGFLFLLCQGLSEKFAFVFRFRVYLTL